MKRVVKFIKRYCVYILLVVAALAVLIGGYLILHHIATAERGYEAIGGEICVFFVPLIIYAIHRNIKDTKEALRDEK